MNDTTASFSGGFSNRIDFWLGSLDHLQIVILSYAVSAIVLLFLVGYILIDGKRQKAKLAKLEASGLTRRSKNAGNTHG